MMQRKIKINFTDFWEPNTPEAIQNNPIFTMLSKRFELELSDNPDYLIYSCYGREFLKYKCMRILYVSENLRPNFNECDYAFSFDYPITERNYRLPLFVLIPYFKKIDAKKNLDEIIQRKTKFCNFVYSKNIPFRNEFFKKLSRYKKVDAPGICMNNMPPIGYHANPLHSSHSPCWDEEKVQFLTNYKFTIAFENSSYPGYTTEKIIHAMIANSIPIYWGNPLVIRDFNPKSFVNFHDYNSIDEVIERVIEIDNNDDLYRKYLTEPRLLHTTENEYLNEDNILNRFEYIFTNRNIKLVAKNTDIFKCHIVHMKSSIGRRYPRIKEIWRNL